MNSGLVAFLSVILAFVAIFILECALGLRLADEKSEPIRDHAADLAAVHLTLAILIGKGIYQMGGDQYSASHLSVVHRGVLLSGLGFGFYCWDEVLGLLRGDDLTNKQLFFAWCSLGIATAILWPAAQQIVDRVRQSRRQPPGDGDEQ